MLLMFFRIFNVLIIPTFITRLACHTSTTKKGDYCHMAKNETRRRSIIMSGKQAKSFFLSMNIIK